MTDRELTLKLGYQVVEDYYIRPDGTEDSENFANDEACSEDFAAARDLLS